MNMVKQMAPTLILTAGLISFAACSTVSQGKPGPNVRPQSAGNLVSERILPPDGYRRVTLPDSSFGAWLRNFRLKPGNPPVKLYNGSLKGDQSVHVAVLDIDAFQGDLQQCADSVMRLRAEYFFSRNRFDDIHFNFTSGDRVSFSRWAKGERPSIRGNSVVWTSGHPKGTSRQNFREYLKMIFTYAGTDSLSREMKTVADPNQVQPGDVFIHGGFPGHAVLVMDVAERPSDGKKVFLLAQGFMPAQDIHLLKNPTDDERTPWYVPGSGSRLVTPEYSFDWTELKRFE
jgi:hypothetical protein